MEQGWQPLLGVRGVDRRPRTQIASTRSRGEDLSHRTTKCQASRYYVAKRAAPSSRTAVARPMSDREVQRAVAPVVHAGIDGNQADNTAASAGAVYVFQ